MLIILVIFGIALIAADQAIKYWAVTVLEPVKVMPFIRFGDVEILGFRYVENTGAAFSSFAGARWFLTVLVAVLLVLLLIFTIRYKYKTNFFLLSVTIIMAGGIGNLIDRVRLGYVIDYIDVKLFNFAVFNFADVCVVLGVIFVLIHMIFIEPKAAAHEQGFKQEVKKAKERSDEQM